MEGCWPDHMYIVFNATILWKEGCIYWKKKKKEDNLVEKISLYANTRIVFPGITREIGTNCLIKKKVVTVPLSSNDIFFCIIRLKTDRNYASQHHHEHVIARYAVLSFHIVLVFKQNRYITDTNFLHCGDNFICCFSHAAWNIQIWCILVFSNFVCKTNRKQYIRNKRRTRDRADTF
jgi:hypothetical protein